MNDQPRAVYRFTLRRADVLRFVRGRRVSGWRLAVLAGWMSLAPLGLGIIAGDWERDWRFWGLGIGLLALQGGLAFLALDVAVRHAAARMLPAPRDLVLEEHADHLRLREDGAERIIAFAEIGSSSIGPGYLALNFGREALLVPSRAFASRSEAVALLARIEAASSES